MPSVSVCSCGVEWFDFLLQELGVNCHSTRCECAIPKKGWRSLSWPCTPARELKVVSRLYARAFRTWHDWAMNGENTKWSAIGRIPFTQGRPLVSLVSEKVNSGPLRCMQPALMSHNIVCPLRRVEINVLGTFLKYRVFRSGRSICRSEVGIMPGFAFCSDPKSLVPSLFFTDSTRGLCWTLYGSSD